jgi:hypothetical protein
MTKHYIFHHSTYWVDEWEFDSYECTSHTLNGGGLDEDDCVLQIVESLDYMYYEQIRQEDEDGILWAKVCRWLGARGITWEFVRIP